MPLVKFLIELVSTTKEDRQQAGIMVPIPQYPLYSATVSEYNNCLVSFNFCVFHLIDNELQNSTKPSN